MPIVIPTHIIKPEEFTIKIDENDYDESRGNFEKVNIRTIALQQSHYAKVTLPNDRPVPTRPNITCFLTIGVLSKMFDIPYPTPKMGELTNITADGITFSFAEDDNGKLFIIAAATTSDGLKVEDKFVTNKDSNVVVNTSAEKNLYAGRVKANKCQAIRDAAVGSLLFNKVALFSLISTDPVPKTIEDEHTRLYLMLADEAGTGRSYFGLGRTVGNDFVYTPPCPPICYY